MIEETGKVVAVENGRVWVETVRQSACGSCAAQKGCGQSVLAKLLSPKANHVSALCDLELQVGDEVVIGVPEDVVVKGSLAVYFLPMVALMVGALGGNSLALLWSISSDLASGLGALLGFAGGLLWVRWHARAVSRDERYQPVVLRQHRTGFHPVQMHSS